MLKIGKGLLSVLIAGALAFTINIKAYAVTTERLGGADRYETSLKISRDGWQNSEYAVIASGENFPDALCATPLAKKYNAPIILTNGTALDDNTSQELSRLGVKHVFIIGGTGVVSQSIDKSLSSMNIGAVRLAGSNRYETSAKVAKQLGNTDKIVMVTGESFPDALSISAIAGSKGMSILLVEKDRIPESIKQLMNGSNYTKIYAVGGPGVLSDSILRNLKNTTRLWGADRYGTNLAVLKEFASDLNYKTTYLSTAENFPDALSGSAEAAKTSSPLVLINSVVPDATLKYVNSMVNSINTLKVLGGTGVVSMTSVHKLLMEKSYTVVIDAGHGGYDSGATGPTGIREKDVNLAVALKLGKILQDQGIQVVYTRTSDNINWSTNERANLQSRVDIGNNSNANFFISIHSNSYSNSSVGGVSNYYSTYNPGGKPFADAIQSELIKTTGLYDRKVLTADFYVLKHSNIPAVLVEMAFISNPNEEKLLNSDSFQNTTAIGISKGIITVLGK